MLANNIPTIKIQLKDIVSICPNLETLHIKSESYKTLKSFGNRVLEILNDEETFDLQLTAVAKKGFYGFTCNGYADAKKRGLFKDFKKISDLTFTVITKEQQQNYINNINVNF